MTVQEALELILNATYGEEVRGAIHDAIEAIDGVAENFIPLFSSSASYVKDDLVFYNDDIYRFTKAHIGVWNAADVEQTTVADELRQVSSSEDYALAAFPTDTASGSIANFSDGADNVPVKSLVAQITPVQDLNGYDAPWPAGGGANRLNESDLVTGAWLDVSTGNYNYNPSGYPTRRATENYQPCDPSTAYYFAAYLNGTAVSDTYALIVCWYDSSKAFISAQNADVTPHAITSPSNAVFFRLGVVSASHTVAVNYPSSVTTYFPYSNVCPITGWTGAEITRIGKNWLNYGSSVYTESGVTFTRTANGTVVCNGTSTALIVYTFAWNIDPKGQSFILSGCPAGGGVDTYRLDARTDAGTGISGSFDYGSGSSAFTPSGSSFRVCIRIASGVTVNNLTFLPMLRLASVADDTYAPYSGDTYTATWTDEVLGGSADVATGELVSDMRSTNNFGVWNLITTVTPNYFETANIVTTLDLDRRAELLCNKYKTAVPSGSNTDDYCCGFTSGGRLRVRDSRYSTAADLAASLSDAQFVYPLATPTSAEFDPIEVKTLPGDNSIWADTGDIDLIYRADPSKYIEKKLAELPNAQGVEF